MYYRDTTVGRVEWTPEYTQHGVTAMNELVDELFQEGDSPIEVSREKATQVRERYTELVENDPDIVTEETDQTTEETQ